MHKLMGIACRRTVALTAGVMLIGGAVGGVLLTPGTALAGPLIATTTAVTGTTQTSTWPGTTLNVQVSVIPVGSSSAWPTGTVQVSDGAGGGCTVTLAKPGATDVGAGSCNIYHLPDGNYSLKATYEGSTSFGESPSNTYPVTIGSAPAFTADSPSLTAADGQSYGYTFHATGAPAPTYALAPGAPSWLNINRYTGAVWGTVPNWANSFSYSVTASNRLGTATAGPYTVSARAARVNLSTYLSCTPKVYTGHRGTCTLWVTDRGYSPARNVTAQIVLPAQLRADYCGYFWSFGCQIRNNTAHENLGTLNPGQTKLLTVVFTARTGLYLWGWHPGRRLTVKVVGSAASNGAWWSGQRVSYSAAWVTIIPRGHWW